MDHFSPDQVAAAIARAPLMATDALRRLLERARLRRLADLAAACEAELALRGPTSVDAAKALRRHQASALVRGLPLEEAICHAFDVNRPNPTEQRIIDIVASRPGVSHRELCEASGKDVNLYIGYFTHDRDDFFRRLRKDYALESALFFVRAPTPPARYTLRAEALRAFKRLGIVEQLRPSGARTL